MYISSRGKLKKVKEDNLKPKESETCLYLHKYMDIPQKSFCIVEDGHPGPIENLIYFWGCILVELI